MNTKNRPVIRIVWSILLIALLGIAYNLYLPLKNIAQAQAGVRQLSNNPFLVGWSLWFAQHNVVGSLLVFIGLVVLALIWIPWLLRVRKARLGSTSLLAVILLSMILSACAPYKGTTVVQIQTNQTAFMLPAQGNTTDQAKFGSIDFLRSHKVASKVVEITYRQHQIGRTYMDVDFVPNELLFLVDRTPVNRQYTYSKETGTENKNQAVALESKESIGFHHGITISAVIEEADTPTFLYYYGGSGKQEGLPTGVTASIGLEQVVDEFVYTWVSQQLYAEFKSRTLAEDQNDAAQIFQEVEARAKENFKQYGISIISLGGIEGLLYDNDEVQKAIDSKFNAASQATAQAVTNTKDIEQAGARATITVREAAAQAEALQMTGEKLAQYPGIVNKTLADKSTGQVPSVLVVQNTDNNTTTMPFPFWFYYPDGKNGAAPTMVPTQAATATALP
jgi:hypothetical protein